MNGRVEETGEIQAEWLRHSFGLPELQGLVVHLDTEAESIYHQSRLILEAGVEAVAIVAEWHTEALS